MKILLLSDHVDKMSGVGIMSKSIVLYSPDEYEWVQLGGATKKGNPEIIELQSESATKSIKVYPYDTYGDRQILLELIQMVLMLTISQRLIFHLEQKLLAFQRSFNHV